VGAPYAEKSAKSDDNKRIGTKTEGLASERAQLA
jgi:hypothetical protein